MILLKIKVEFFYLIGIKRKKMKITEVDFSKKYSYDVQEEINELFENLDLYCDYSDEEIEIICKYKNKKGLYLYCKDNFYMDGVIYPRCTAILKCGKQCMLAAERLYGRCKKFHKGKPRTKSFERNLRHGFFKKNLTSEDRKAMDYLGNMSLRDKLNDATDYLLVLMNRAERISKYKINHKQVFDEIKDLLEDKADNGIITVHAKDNIINHLYSPNPSIAHNFFKNLKQMIDSCKDYDKNMLGAKEAEILWAFVAKVLNCHASEDINELKQILNYIIVFREDLFIDLKRLYSDRPDLLEQNTTFTKHESAVSCINDNTVVVNNDLPHKKLPENKNPARFNGGGEV